MFGVGAALATPKTIPEGGLRSPPPLEWFFGGAVAAQTPKIDDFRPAQTPCIKNQSFKSRKVDFGAAVSAKCGSREVEFS